MSKTAVQYFIESSLPRSRGIAFPDRKVSTAGIFAAGIIILFVYLLGMRYHAYLPVPLFFISIFLIIGTIMYQCLALNLSSGFAGVVLAEIALASLVFHLIYQIPGYGLWGSDSYLDVASLKAILMTGHVRGVPEYVQLTSYFPVIHILGAEVSLITGVDYLAVAKWLPSVTALVMVPLVYLLTRLIFKKEKVALLSALLFASLQHHVLFGSLFVRENVALVLMLCCIYFYLAARHSGYPLTYRALSVLFLAGTVLAHHLTSLMLIVFLGVHWLVTSASRLVPGWARGKTVTENIGLSFLLIALLGTFTYWMTTVVEPVQILITFARNILARNVWGTYTYLGQTSLTLPSIRYYFLIYGSYLSYIVFGLFLLRKLIQGVHQLEAYSFSVFLSLCGAVGIIALYILPATVSGDRFLTFGWLFAFGPMVLSVLENRHIWLVRIGVSFMVFFMFLNMYTIHPTVWDSQAPGAGGAAWREDFELARKVNVSDGTIIANLNNLMAIYELQNRTGTDAFALSDPIDVRNFTWVIVNEKGLKQEGIYSGYTQDALTDIQSLELEQSPDHFRNYKSNNLEIFQRR